MQAEIVKFCLALLGLLLLHAFLCALGPELGEYSIWAFFLASISASVRLGWKLRRAWISAIVVAIALWVFWRLHWWIAIVIWRDALHLIDGWQVQQSSGYNWVFTLAATAISVVTTCVAGFAASRRARNI